jgi:hypothetical protein
MIRAFLTLVLFSLTHIAWASGPVAPKGWDGSFEPTLPSGQPCCIPADLNGTNLVGGAFVLLTTNKREFGVFALTYTPPLKQHWQLLERHRISELESYRVSVERPAGKFPFEFVKVCAKEQECVVYYTASATAPLKRSHEVKP